MASLEERVVARLREAKIKLWLEPYDDDDDAVTALAVDFAAALDADAAVVAAELRKLRQHALEKLAAKRRRTICGSGVGGPFEVVLDGSTSGDDARAVLAAAGGHETAAGVRVPGSRRAPARAAGATAGVAGEARDPALDCARRPVAQPHGEH